MTRRNKQIAYGGFYAVFWFAIIYGFYVGTLKPAPSCHDNKKNGDEVEVDCGGANCEACAIKHLLPIKVSSVAFVPSGTADTATAVVGFQNPNSTYGATSFDYHIEFFSPNSSSTPVHTEDGTSFIYPSQAVSHAFVNLPFASGSITRQTEAISNVKWLIAASMSIPKFQITQLKAAAEGGHGQVTGILRNNSDFPIQIATINGYLLDVSRTIVAASRTAIQDITPGEERFFQVNVPLPAGADVSVLQPNVSVEAKR